MKEPKFDVKEEAQALREAIAEVNKHIARLTWMGYDVNVDYHRMPHHGVAVDVRTYIVEKIWKEEVL